MHPQHLNLISLPLLLLFSCGDPRTKQSSLADSFSIDNFVWLEDSSSQGTSDWIVSMNKSLLSYESSPFLLRFLESSSLPTASSSASHTQNHGKENEREKQCGVRAFSLLKRTSKNQPGILQLAKEAFADKDSRSEQLKMVTPADQRNDWQLRSSNCLAPLSARCLNHYSFMGQDKAIISETFVGRAVENGFNHKEYGRHNLQWLSKDLVLINPGGPKDLLTRAGYPRELKLWHRGESLASAKSLSIANDNYGSPYVFNINFDDGRRLRLLATPNGWQQINDQGEILPLDLDYNSYPIAAFGTDGILVSRSPTRFNVAAAATTPYSVYDMKNKAYTTLPLKLDENTRQIQIMTGNEKIVMLTNENLQPKVSLAYRTTFGFELAEAKLPNELGKVKSAILLNSPQGSEQFYAVTSDFLGRMIAYQIVLRNAGPATIEFVRVEDALDSAESKHYVQDISYATSADGRLVPYYTLQSQASKAALRNKPLPTLIHVYGGFSSPAEPSPMFTKLYKPWLEQGGVVIIPALRGGGELGSSWYLQGILENKQNTYNDLYAVAEDLLDKGIANADSLGVTGASNGGLTACVAGTQRPDLFAAVHCGSPLTDMLKFHKLEVGYSWVSEYGDPDYPQYERILRAYSPYHNVKTKQRTRFLLTTATTDDRVHPSHARKMAARLQEQDNVVVYYESVGGGHGGPAYELGPRSRAYEFSFFAETLGMQ